MCFRLLTYRYTSVSVGGLIKVTIVITPDKLFVLPFKCAMK